MQYQTRLKDKDTITEQFVYKLHIYEANDLKFSFLSILLFLE